RVAEQLATRGHQPLVIAPEPARSTPRPDGACWFPVVRVPSVPMPGYPGFRIGLSASRVRSALARHYTDLVHLASPFVLGASGCAAARDRRLPARRSCLRPPVRHRSGGPGRVLAAAAQDTQRGRPHSRPVHSDGRRPPVAWPPGGGVLAGYVGRLAAEKRVDLLAGVAALPGARLVIVGSGPAEAAARRAMPAALFLGQRRGAALASLYASLDVFVHSGPHETFGQTLQEAAASGLPVVAPAAGGPLDLVDQGVTGFLVPPGDCGALAAAVARLAADPALRAAQGLAAREKVLGRGWPVLCEELIGHCHALLEAASAPAAGVPAGPRS